MLLGGTVEFFDQARRATTYVIAGTVLATAGAILSLFASSQLGVHVSELDDQSSQLARELDLHRTLVRVKQLDNPRSADRNDQSQSRSLLEHTTTHKLVTDARFEQGAGTAARDRAILRVRGEYSQLKELFSEVHTPNSGLRLSSIRLSRADATPVSQLIGEVALEVRP